MSPACQIGVGNVRAEEGVVLVTSGDGSDQIQIGKIGPLAVAATALGNHQKTGSLHRNRLEKRDEGSIIDTFPAHHELKNAVLLLALRGDLHSNRCGEISD